MRKILFITTSNLTTNPRLYKEVKVASKRYRTTVLCFNLGSWSDEIDKKLLTTIPDTKTEYISARRNSYLPWLITAAAQKAAAILWPFFESSTLLCAAVSNKRSIQLCNHLSLYKDKYADCDLIVAHNLGALYPAQQLSNQLGIPFTFDVEDYHPGEKIDHDAKHEKERRERLMQRLLPAAKSVTAASPLISAEVKKLTGVKVKYISNSFYSSEFQLKKENNQVEVKFVWFSQNITFGRGLELFISQLDNLKGNFSLTLIGNLNQAFADEWIVHRSFIKTLYPQEQGELHNMLANYDVGLALELSEVDLNKQLALSNKLYAYLQAGLFVIATDTQAQKNLLQEFSTHGLVSEQTDVSLTKSINFVLDNIADIRNEKEKRFVDALTLAYEQEGQKLLALWDELMSKENNEENHHRISTFPAL